MDDEAVASHALARGLVTPAQLAQARQREALLRQAGVGGGLLDALEGVLEPGPLAELRALAGAPPAPSVATPTLAGAPTAPAAPAPPSGRLLPSFVKPGDRIGPYVVQRELGRGGMGAVYAAEHEALRRRVALKVRLPFAADGGRGVERFLREAQAAARLHHPDVVGVHEMGRDAAGRAWIAMDLVEGESLDRRLERSGPLPVGEVVRLGARVARALAHAHAHGVLHRDLKPANIMVRGADGAPLITDFGLAKVVEGAESLTRTGEVLGTPSYMSPEQARGQAVDARADVWALGATLYHLLVGRPPFTGAGLMAILAAVLKGEVTPPRRLRADVPPDLEAVLLRCLAPLPGRYQDASALADELERVAAGEATDARDLAREARRQRWLVLGLTASLLGLVPAGLAALALAPRPDVGAPGGKAAPSPERTPAERTPPEQPPARVATAGTPPAADTTGSPPPAPAVSFARPGVWERARHAEAPPCPPGRWCHTATYDPRRGEVLVFGGKRGTTGLADLWGWDGARWTDRTGAGPGPEPRYGHAAAYDVARRCLVVHGGCLVGQGHTPQFDAVWEHDGSAWRQVAAGAGPGPGKRAWHALAYDPARRRVVLFGGFDAAARETADLWAWDGEGWTPLPAGPAPGPSPRRFASAAWLARRDALLVVGATSGAQAAEAWEWQPERGWSQDPPTGLGPRQHPPLTEADGRAFLFGGTAARGGLNDTWQRDGARWSPLGEGLDAELLPRARDHGTLTFDERRRVLVLFGGEAGGARNDLWELTLER